MMKNPVPKKYPYVIFLRKDTDSYLNDYLSVIENDLSFSFEFISYNPDNTDFINKLYSEDYNILCTIGDDWKEFNINHLMISKMNKKWIHLQKDQFTDNDAETLNNKIMYCFVNNLHKRSEFRPKISCFTTSFQSFEKILRPFNSLKTQIFPDWEWVIIDDSKDDSNFEFIRNNISSQDHRIRAYRKDFHSGSIGNVKNEAVSLCRGEFVLELDHDDEILPDTLLEIVNGFEKYPDVGFVYMNFAECYEDKKPFKYPDGWAFGYGGYKTEYHDGVLYEVAQSADINDITMSNIVGVPNHPRAWRKSVLIDIGNYSEALPVADDYEVLLLTSLKTKMLKINKFGYIQYKNASNNNFSLIRNKEITKLQSWISHVYYQMFKVPEFFQNLGVNEKLSKLNAHINYSIDSAFNNVSIGPQKLLSFSQIQNFNTQNNDVIIENIDDKPSSVDFDELN